MALRPDVKDLSAWLKFEDWIKYSPTDRSWVTIRGRTQASEGKYPLPGWLQEGLVIHSALVNPADVSAAIDGFHFRELPAPWWADGEEFTFGAHVLLGSIALEPFVVELPKAGANEAIADIRQDFVVYHQLRRTDEGNYRHPYEDQVIVEIKPYGDGMEIPAEVLVNLDFLRDYLAARKRALLWTITMDRYASLESREEFGLEPHGNMKLKPGTWRQIDLHENPKGDGVGWTSRGTLFMTVAIDPYAEPKVTRNPWSIAPLRSGSDSSISFIVDAAGSRMVAREMDPPPMVLYFRRQVLERYLLTPGHNAFFITRRWGRAVNARHRGVDIGLNDRGLITAFAADVLALGEDEQAYWSAHNVAANGEICRDWFQTRMMNDPPNVKGVVALIDVGKNALNDALKGITGRDAYSGARPNAQSLGAISIGPLTDTPDAFSRLAMTLCQLAIDPLQDDVVRSALPSGSKVPSDSKSLILLERLLMARSGLGEGDAKRLVQPLRTLNWLRLQAAHVGIDAFGKALNEVGFTVRPDYIWEAWDALVDRTAESLHAVAAHLRLTIPEERAP